MTLFRGQQSKAAEGQGKGEVRGRVAIVHREEAAPQACRLMDDEVVRMLIFKGRLVSGEQGLRGKFVFIYLWFCFKQQQEAEEPCSQLAKKFRIRKKIGRGEGEKRKKVAKNTGQ